MYTISKVLMCFSAILQIPPTHTTMMSTKTFTFLSRLNFPYYERRESHKTQTDSPGGEETYCVLSLHTDSLHHQAMSALRKRYYPPAVYRVSAHISLFRALPGSLLHSIQPDIVAAVACISPFEIRTVGPPIRMGSGGVSVPVTGLAPVEELVKDIQCKWRSVLSHQDRGAFRGHYTLMNKEKASKKVEQCLEDMRQEFPPQGIPGLAIGLSLWRYDNGWWRHKRDFAFSKVEKGNS
ncbi:hypothetical protein F4806DRAFT_453111 [Annulohypoxylon nitens]|nr:hypothetical protein F4806DRAFT_453111 [Annulohypoxylon nitens]